ncbi:unnamed protein product [Macrosiphum euphorbiae]|uniref:BACK domain-containing protein n=1 Tax=Macrosiphum euphorbiae TaxID=13131 RepID=A0AAV0XTN5_9HEMI|nr:unnamed protein product [Macrosiphum euphorbiae]
MVKLISCDELKVPSEEKVFESVIRWVKYDLRSRKCILTQLMEHVRLPLTSKDNILKKIVEEPLINNCLKSKDYIIEAQHFHLLKSDELVTIPHHIRTKPRQPEPPYWKPSADMLVKRRHLEVGVINNHLYAVEGVDGLSKRRLNSVECYHPSLDKWTPVTKMRVRPSALGISVISTGIWTSIPDSIYVDNFQELLY